MKIKNKIRAQFRSKMWITEVPQREKKENRKKIIEEIIQESFPEPETKCFQIERAHWISSGWKQTNSHHDKISETKDKEERLPERENSQEPELL